MRVLIAVFIGLLLIGEASAQSCNSLRKQLAAAQNNSGGAQAARLREQYRAFSCASSSRFGRHRACGGIEAQLRSLGGGGRGVGDLQRRVAAACAPSAPRQQIVRAEPRTSTSMIGGRVVERTPTRSSASDGRRDRGGFFSRIFGDDRREDVRIVRTEPAGRIGPVERLDRNGRPTNRRTDDAVAVQATRSYGRVKGQTREGNARTVCVRLCDGFYFPINSRSHSDNYYDELAMCIGRCPGADVSLYAHNADSPVESMRSTMTGERYINLPTAFAYRKTVAPSCGCQPQSMAPEDMSAEKALGYVGQGTTSAIAEAAAEAAAGARDWTPFAAVYDDTGKPLEPLLTDRSLASPDEHSTTRGVAPARPIPSAAAVSMGPQGVREVGPQFYSDVKEPRAPRRRPAVLPRSTTTAVTVVPLRTPRAVDPVAQPDVAPPDVIPSAHDTVQALPGVRQEATAPAQVHRGG